MLLGICPEQGQDSTGPEGPGEGWGLLPPLAPASGEDSSLYTAGQQVAQWWWPVQEAHRAGNGSASGRW